MRAPKARHSAQQAHLGCLHQTGEPGTLGLPGTKLGAPATWGARHTWGAYTKLHTLVPRAVSLPLSYQQAQQAERAATRHRCKPRSCTGLQQPRTAAAQHFPWSLPHSPRALRGCAAAHISHRWRSSETWQSWILSRAYTCAGHAAMTLVWAKPKLAETGAHWSPSRFTLHKKPPWPAPGQWGAGDTAAPAE